MPRVPGHSEPESAALPSGSLLQSVLAALSAKQLSAGAPPLKLLKGVKLGTKIPILGNQDSSRQDKNILEF